MGGGGGIPGTCPGGGGNVSGMGGGPDGGADEDVPRLKKFVCFLPSVGGGGRAEKKPMNRS